MAYAVDESIVARLYSVSRAVGPRLLYSGLNSQPKLADEEYVLLSNVEILNSCLGLGILLDLWREGIDEEGYGAGLVKVQKKPE